MVFEKNGKNTAKNAGCSGEFTVYSCVLDLKFRKKYDTIVNVKWPLIMTGVSFLLSVTMSFIASEALASVGILAAFFILIAIIVIGCHRRQGAR